MFARVRNEVSIERLGDDESVIIYAAIPCEFFTYAKEVLKIPAEGINTVSFYLDQETYSKWVFGFDYAVDGEERNVDLWSYPSSKIPAWIRGGMSFT